MPCDYVWHVWPSVAWAGAGARSLGKAVAIIPPSHYWLSLRIPRATLLAATALPAKRAPHRSCELGAGCNVSTPARYLGAALAQHRGAVSGVQPRLRRRQHLPEHRLELELQLRQPRAVVPRLRTPGGGRGAGGS